MVFRFERKDILTKLYGFEFQHQHNGDAGIAAFQFPFFFDGWTLAQVLCSNTSQKTGTPKVYPSD
jgi:hypothetical protein